MNRIARSKRWVAEQRLHDVVTVERHGRSYDLGVLKPSKARNRILAGGLWEEAVCEWVYDQNLSGTAIDVGASIGHHSVWFAAVCDLHVEAFEPVYWWAVEANAEGHDITVHRCLLGDSEGVAGHEGIGRMRVGAGDLPMRTLDSFDLEPALLKIDTEGMEPQVLRGGLETIAQHRPVILAEAWGPNEHAAAAEILEPLGYRWLRRFKSGGVDAWVP